ncbi:BSD domain-containing protein 1-A [Diaphorina citri]|uniref:BSD domain-containing protein 1-A n=1 Tax=Diaphorina citri TaxID=121845 RepID=A0A3Q0J2M6_DIACI|nr:BSD domain-containing protein 1-A [Diaphorina citri]
MNFVDKSERITRIDNTSSKENDATTPSSSDWWKGFLDAARNKVGAVLLVSMIERSTTLDLKVDGSIPDQSGLKKILCFCVSRIDNTSSKENDATTPSSSDWWKGFLDAARNKSAEVLEFVKKDFDELSTTVKTEATNVVQQTTTVFRETLQLDKPESTASSMKKSVSTFLDQVSTVLNPSPDDEDEEAVVIHGTDVVPLTRLQAQLYALSNEPDTYLKEIDSINYAWLELLEEQGNKQLSNEKLIKMLVNNPQLQDNFQNLVPNQT